CAFNVLKNVMNIPVRINFNFIYVILFCLRTTVVYKKSRADGNRLPFRLATSPIFCILILSKFFKSQIKRFGDIENMPKP
ncbi:hypothetical protein, partial [Aequorivita xiaoshiensis]